MTLISDELLADLDEGGVMVHEILENSSAENPIAGGSEMDVIALR
jgi:hypothetical protein